MTHRFLAIAAASALMLTASAALADEAGTVYGARVDATKTVGALAFETRGLAVSSTDVRRQGGFASAGAARWTRTPVAETHANAF